MKPLTNDRCIGQNHLNKMLPHLFSVLNGGKWSIFVGNKPLSDATSLACLSNLEDSSFMRWSRKGITTVSFKYCSTESNCGFEQCLCTWVIRGMPTVIPECSASLRLCWKILSAYALTALRSVLHSSILAYPEQYPGSHLVA